jgi:hypothetical protein
MRQVVGPVQSFSSHEVALPDQDKLAVDKGSVRTPERRSRADTVLQDIRTHRQVRRPPARVWRDGVSQVTGMVKKEYILRASG